ncbi:DUF1127 domain-containing protein [Roseibium sediminicola]|uniref:DUF1127 domain-containing protein n=1 Tax=Roseibium sediminicola TaxID=2933272 RepID=A0ABT0GNF1_9HYPH|nr:DUF1127 domain-containing protein [Roseibium sp. CAU 1639]MCK7610943.1 DUF1127 domain-containing protein [Roseibium sp. CAU 1639]
MSDQILPTYLSGPKQVAQFNLLRVAWRAWRGVFARLRRHRDRAHLAELPDYLLEDVGLTRTDLPVVLPVKEEWR